MGNFLKFIEKKSEKKCLYLPSLLLLVALGQCTQKAGGNLQQICKCYTTFVAVAKKIDCAAAQTAVDGIDNACNAIHCTGCGGKTSLPDCSQAQTQQVGTASIALSTCVIKNPQD